MKNVEMKVIRFDANDVIATSDVIVNMSNLANNNVLDNTLTYKGVTYTYQNMNDFYTVLGTDASSAKISDSSSGTEVNKTFGKVFGGVTTKGYSDSSSGAIISNGSYIWDGTKFTFKQ